MNADQKKRRMQWERAVDQMAAGDSGPLHEILKEERSLIGVAYREITLAYDAIDEPDDDTDPLFTHLRKAMAFLRQIAVHIDGMTTPPKRSDR